MAVNVEMPMVIPSRRKTSVIAAAMPRSAAGAASIAVFDVRADAAEALAARLRAHAPALEVRTGSDDPAGFDIVVNATPLGMNDGDPMPMDVARIASTAFVGEVVMKREMTPFLQAAAARGCRFQIGLDMLFEQIPAYLEYFGLPAATTDELRAVAQISY